MITEQYIPRRYFSQVYDGTHVMAGHCGGGSTSIVGTRKEKDSLCALPETRDVAAAPQTPQLGGATPTLGAQVSLKLLFGYVTIFSSADFFTTDLNCRKKLACDIISECNVILSRTI